MVSLLLMAALANGPVADKLVPYRGQPVLSVTIEAPADEDQDFLYRLIDIQPGYLVSAEDLQSAIKRLYALGRFANVYVDAQRLSGVVMLRFRLRPIRRLEELQIHGLSRADEGFLRQALELKPGDEIARSTGAQLEAAAKAHLARVGFPRARAKVREGALNPDTARQVLRLFIQEGRPEIVTEVKFTGTPRVQPAVLRGLVATRVGGVLDHAQLERDREALEGAYLERGFLRAEVLPPISERAGEGWVVKYPINAGDRIGVYLTGNHVVGDAVLFALWPFATRRLEPGRLERFANRIRDHYLRLGYADVSVNVRGWRDSAEGISRYLLEINEGELLRVVGIEFHGTEAIPSDTLKNQVAAVLEEELANQGSMVTQFLLETQGETPAWGRPDFEPNYDSPIPPEQRWVPELYEQALHGIRAVYRDRGYLDAHISEPVLQPGPKPGQVVVRVDVSEGPQTTISALSFRGNTALAAAGALAVVEGTKSAGGVQVHLGGPYTPSGLEEARIALVRQYRDQGYLYARIFTDVNVRDEGRAEVVYRVEEGPQVRVRNVLVSGNRHTSLDTILAQMTLEPGSIYRLEQALADRRAVARLGLFSAVQVRLIDEDRPEEQKDLVVEVNERDRHQVGLLVGFSTADGVRWGGNYTHLNLFGNGTQLSLDARFNLQFLFSLYGERQQALEERYESYYRKGELHKAVERDLRAGIRSRRLFLIPQVGTTLRMDITNQRDNSVAYSLDETAFTVGGELNIVDVINLAVEPQISFTDLECPELVGPGDEDCVTAVQFQRSRPIEEGQRFTFKVGPNLTVDLRDNRLNPQSGFWANAQAVWAWGEARQRVADSFLPFSFAKVEAAAIGYIPLFGPVLVLNARGGYLMQLEGQGVPIDERFFLGGRNTLRGIIENTLVPEDVCLDLGLPGTTFDPERCREIYQLEPGQLPITRGGNTYLLLRTELRIPVTESLRVELFVDLGNLWAGTPNERTFRPRVGLGAGLRWETAVGALIADLGFNPEMRLGERIAEPHFSVSNF